MQLYKAFSYFFRGRKIMYWVTMKKKFKVKMAASAAAVATASGVDADTA